MGQKFVWFMAGVIVASIFWLVVMDAANMALMRELLGAR